MNIDGSKLSDEFKLDLPVESVDVLDPNMFCTIMINYVKIRYEIIGVLFRLVWLKIDGAGLDGVYSIYKGHLFFQKATCMRCYLGVQPRLPTFCLLGRTPKPSTLHGI